MVVTESDWMRIQNLPHRIGCGVKKTESAHLWLPDRYAKTLFFNGFPDIFDKIHQALSKEAE